jgi:hypothetical protein
MVVKWIESSTQIVSASETLPEQSPIAVESGACDMGRNEPFGIIFIQNLLRFYERINICMQDNEDQVIVFCRGRSVFQRPSIVSLCFTALRGLHAEQCGLKPSTSF